MTLSVADHGDPISIFLSYSRDDIARATPLIKALEACGFNVWWDGLLEGGAAFARTTETALENAHAVVVLWSAKSVQSHWVRDEATRGRDRGCMVPVSIDGSEPPLGFRQIQYLDLTKWQNKPDAPEIVALERAIRATAAHPGGQLAFAGRLPAKKGPSRRKFLIAGGGVLAATGAGLVLWKKGIGGAPSVNGTSVAVIPFKNMSGDAAQDYFSEGLSEEVRAALARNATLKVVAQTSANIFRSSNVDAKVIAQKLGVSFFFTGSVRRSGDVVRIAASLVDGKTGFSGWTQSFDRKIDNIFILQSEVANAVAAALTAQVGGFAQAQSTMKMSEKSRIGGTTSVSAFDAYLRGQNLYTYGSGESDDRGALDQFDAAIAADPAYAAAHAARSRSLTILSGQYGKIEELAALNQAALAAAQRAIALAPNMAEGYSALGDVLHGVLLDMKGARAPFDRSLALGAGEATINARFARYAALNKRDAEAQRAIDIALSLDPLNPLAHRGVGRVHYIARRFAAVIPPVKQALAMTPNMNNANALIGDALYMLGRTEEARTAYLAEPRAMSQLPGLAAAEWKLGNKDEARNAMARMTADLGDSALYQQALVLSQWGDLTGALTTLEKARSVGDSGLIYLLTDPLLDPLRSDARFSRLLVSVGFA